MVRFTIVFMFAAVMAAVGCNKSTPGGPGASLPPSEQSTIGQTDDSFSLDTPMMSTKLAQGEVKALTIGIKRGENFDQDVTIEFNDLPKGVTIDAMNPSIKHGEADAKVMITAADDAALGDFVVKVTGRPAKGPDAVAELKLTVDAK